MVSVAQETPGKNNVECSLLCGSEQKTISSWYLLIFLGTHKSLSTTSVSTFYLNISVTYRLRCFFFWDLKIHSTVGQALMKLSHYSYSL